MLESSDLLESGANTDVVPRIDPSAVRRCNGMDWCKASSSDEQFPYFQK